MSFVIDTDICSAYLKGDRAVASRFMQYTGGLYLSALTISELFAWVDRAKTSRRRREALLELIKGTHILPMDYALAEYAGTLQAGLLDQGIIVPAVDMLIGATALYNNFTLVTHNQHDFGLIPGLRIQDWMA